MEKKNKYYVVRDKALPEVLQKVVEVKRLLEADNPDSTGGGGTGWFKPQFLL